MVKAFSRPGEMMKIDIRKAKIMKKKIWRGWSKNLSANTPTPNLLNGNCAPTMFGNHVI